MDFVQLLRCKFISFFDIFYFNDLNKIIFFCIKHRFFRIFIYNIDYLYDAYVEQSIL
jgi:hypothetical protein